MLKLFILSKTCIFLTHQSLVILCEWSKAEYFWQVLVDFPVVYCANFSNIEQENGLTSKDMIDTSIFRI